MSNNTTAYKIISASNRPVCEDIVICLIVVNITSIVSEKQRLKLDILTGSILVQVDYSKRHACTCNIYFYCCQLRSHHKPEW